LEQLTRKERAERVRETWLFRGRLKTGVLLIAALLVVLFMMWIVFIYTKSRADQRVFEAIGPHITPIRTRIMRIITYLGNPEFLVPFNLALLVLFAILKKKWMVIRIAVVALGGLGIKLLMKHLFQRLRPLDPVIEGGVAGYSFPSGHALMAVVVYGFLVWWAAISIHNKWKQGIAIALLILLIIGVSFSRIYLRVHYTTDILAGICIGFCWLMFSLWIVDKFEVRSLHEGAHMPHR
jgi:membrane-associated phospholipid phosphatase